jgi:hypothetical protein
MQAIPRCAAGTRASNSALKRWPPHQQGVAKSPLHAGAQAFGPPHSGQACSGNG